MLELNALLEELPPRPETGALVAGFTPPPRFAAKRFAEYVPRHRTQEGALRRLREEAEALERGATGVAGWLRRFGRRRAGGGLYLDGGFGVGKTHLLAALWNAAPEPKSYLSFDELVYFLGLVGLREARAAFADRRLVAVDEWELDDPGNLKLALAFLRSAVADGVRLAVTSNTLPIELGAGRFSQKDFRLEIEELASAFEVVRIEGDDYRHRHFEARPGAEYFVPTERLRRGAEAAGGGALLVPFDELLSALDRVHPIRYSTLVERIGSLHVEEIRTVTRLPEALRWVHFVDTLYDRAVPFAASSPLELAQLFPPDFLAGPYGKKMSRCLSRMEEMLGEADRPG